MIHRKTENDELRPASRQKLCIFTIMFLGKIQSDATEKQVYGADTLNE
jgi:hypothetical protein